MSNESINKYLLLNNKYKASYNVIFILVIVIIFIIILNLKYKTFYYAYAQVVYYDNQYMLRVTSQINSTKYILENNYLYLNNNKYKYKIHTIDENIYIENDSNYQVLYLSLNIKNEYKINNYITSIKIMKQNQKIIYYILDYLKRKE